MRTIRRWARCPVCAARFHVWTQQAGSHEYLWQAERAGLDAWINQHGHASQAQQFRQEMDRWALGYRETAPQAFETVEEEDQPDGRL